MDFLTLLKDEKNLNNRQIAKTIKTEFPAFKRPYIDGCEHSDESGITLTKEAAFLVLNTYAPELVPKPAKKDTHRLHRRLQCRVDEKTYWKIMTAVEKAGYDTVQDWLDAVIRRELEDKSQKEKGK